MWPVSSLAAAPVTLSLPSHAIAFESAKVSDPAPILSVESAVTASVPSVFEKSEPSIAPPDSVKALPFDSALSQPRRIVPASTSNGPLAQPLADFSPVPFIYSVAPPRFFQPSPLFDP